jgi:Asp-tRNA(Asn)/Glu-tRNA(Gln) amidotransferase A subunit family amidase
VPPATTPRLETLSDWLQAHAQLRRVTAAQIVERVRALDEPIHAWAAIAPQAPLGDGPLFGIPVGVKDVFETVGLLTEYGSEMYRGRVGTRDAAIVQELRSRGAIVLGKTHTAEFAYRRPAPTRNPRNLAHTPGGSSSGSAAAVAAGMVPLALGTQTKGSVLRPASYCGVTGFKPTFGAISTEGLLPFAESLDTVGFFTHSPADMIGLWEALGRPVDRDATISVGVPAELPGVDPAMAAAFGAAIARLREAGVAVVTVDLTEWLGRVSQAADTVMFYEAARNHHDRFEQYGDRLGDVANAVRRGRQIAPGEYEAAQRQLQAERARAAAMFAKTAVVLTPAATGPAPEGLGWTGDPAMNSPWTALGTPAIAVPMPVSTALPLGLQLTADRGHDARLLRAAVRIHGILHSGAAHRIH